MKIYIINSMCGSGSTGKIVTDMCSILKKQNHEVRVAFGIGKASNINLSDTYKVNNKLGYYSHNIAAKVTDKTGLFSSKQTKKLVNDIINFSPDIVQLHNLHGYWINYKILFKYLIEANVPIVWTLHDCWSFTGHCSHFAKTNCIQWKIQCKKCPQLKTYPKTYLFSNVKKNYLIKKGLYEKINNLTIVTPSQWLADLVKESILKNHNIITINNGIDLDLFKPKKSNFRVKYELVDYKIILSVANVWDDRKGLHDLMLLNEIISNQYKIVIVGLTKQQKDLLPSSIVGIQRTDGIEELVEIYSAADVFVNLTYEDTFPTVNIEALACGIPIITYNTGGSVEIIDNNNGFVVEQGDIQSLFSLIKSINKFRKDDLLDSAKKYDKHHTYNNYIELYGKILEKADSK